MLKTNNVSLFDNIDKISMYKVNVSLEEFMVKETESIYRDKISNSKNVFEIAKEIYKAFNKDIALYEEFFAIHLSRSNQLIGVHHISSGGISNTIADPKKIFASALVSHSSSLILIHNHPSGSIKPSASDIKLTNQLVSISNNLQLPVLDHLIITKEKYYSFSDEGLIK